MRGVVVAMMLANSGQLALAEDLCPDAAKLPTQEGTRMTEDTFEVPSGLDAADKLIGFLNKEHLAYEFEQVVNSFVVKGVMLRQQALTARTELELAKLKLPTGSAAKTEVDKAEAAAKKSLGKFCAFMVDAVVAE